MVDLNFEQEPVGPQQIELQAAKANQDDVARSDSERRQPMNDYVKPTWLSCNLLSLIVPVLVLLVFGLAATLAYTHLTNN